MESAMDVDEKKDLLDELTEAQELATQLDAIVDQHSPVMGSQGRPLTQRLLQCIKSAISMATKSPNSSDCEEIPCLFQPQSSAALSHFSAESPRESSITTSTASATATGSRIPVNFSASTVARKRYRAVSGTAILRGSCDDGDSWRKYGQKGILGSKHPRDYYRCTHKDTFGCQAKKKVQRDDNDPEVLHVTYYGSHTCPQSQQPSSWPLSPIKTAEATLRESSECISAAQHPTALTAAPVHAFASTAEAGPEPSGFDKETCGGDDERDVGNW